MGSSETKTFYSTAAGVRQSGGRAGLDTPLQYVKGVGPQRAALLEKKGLTTVRDALFFLPLRHEDRTRLTPLRALVPGQTVTCTGLIAGLSPPPPGRPQIPFTIMLREIGRASCRERVEPPAAT